MCTYRELNYVQKVFFSNIWLQMPDCDYKMVDEEANEELLDQLKRMDSLHANDDEPKGDSTMKRYKLKKALGHMGLMVSLSIYCAVGGLVSVVLFSI